MHTSASSGSLSGRRREPRLTYLLRPTDAAVHISGVNALAVSPDGRLLFSGGRDGSVRRWQAGEDAAATSAGGSHGCFEGHTDWVTALAWVGPSLLCSASCDTTLRLWRADAESPPGAPPASAAATLRAHRDYITSLAAAGAPGGQVTHFASGGLGGELLLWDAAEARAVAASAGAGPTPLPAGGAKASVYALAAAAPTVLLAGGAEHALRLWDVRKPGACAAKLRGHTDTVRALLVDAAGTRAVSAGADRAMRLWDLRALRCVAALVPTHADSVWSLAGDEQLTAVWSGGRDGALWHASLDESWSAPDAAAAAAAARCTLLASPRGGEPITALALDGAAGAGSGVWVATSSSSLQRWSRSPGPPPPASSTAAAAGRSVRPAMATPRHAAPLATVRGAPGLRRAEALPDRRRLLTQDSAGELAIWDVQSAAPSRKVTPPAPKAGPRGAPPPQPLTPAQAFEAARADLARQRCAVPSWFAADTRTGCLAIHLDCPAAFAAEAYSTDFEVAGASEDAKVNLGAEALRCVLGPFARRRQRQLESAAGAGALAEDGMVDEPPPPPPMASCFKFPMNPPPTLVFDAPDGTRHRWNAYALTGSDSEAAALPTWAVDLVLYNRMPPGCAESPKMAFHLLPAEGCGLAPLATAKLNAPRILRVSKVAQYVASKLDLAADMEEGEGDSAVELELSCAGQMLPADMTLATVHQFVWRKPGEELQIQYAHKRPDAGRRLP